MLTDLLTVFAIVAGTGAIPGYFLGWRVANRGGKTRCFQRRVSDAQHTGMTRHQRAALIGIRVGISCGLRGCPVHGLLLAAK
jgi:hypothetical protein